MALRLTPRRERALRELYLAGPAGVAIDALIDEEGCAVLLTAHLLAEEFTDPTRAFPDRIRLTPTGVTVATWHFSAVRSAA